MFQKKNLSRLLNLEDQQIFVLNATSVKVWPNAIESGFDQIEWPVYLKTANIKYTNAIFCGVRVLESEISQSTSCFVMTLS